MLTERTLATAGMQVPPMRLEHLLLLRTTAEDER
jgi:hypothetical protein